ncbi:MAG TPA: hypothetical protein VLG28_13420 [Acidimicrobiia bacterium]|nr:hypothetical protein [Acidimicrobiia bacterium]
MTIDVAPGLGRMVGQRFAVRDLLRRIAVQGVAGVVAGVLVAGIGGRILMRLSAAAAGSEMVGRITENGNRIGTLSLDGTIQLIIFGGALFGAVAAALLVLLRPWLAWAGRWQGPVAGLALLGIAGATVITSHNVDFSILDPAWLNVGMFVVLVVGYGWAATALADWWMRRDITSGPMLLHVALIVLGIPFLSGMFALLLSEEACGCESMPGVAVVLMLTGVATVAMWVAQMTDHAGTVRVLRPIGIGLTTVAFALGTAQLVSEIATII